MLMEYKRILLKLSGESLMGNDSYGINYQMVRHFSTEIKSAVDMGVQVGVVIGGGNIFRGVQGADKGFDRRQGDQMGMLATIINAMAMQAVLEELGVPAKMLTAVTIEGVSDKISWRKADDLLNQGNVVILGGGTGNPYFSTDSAAALKASEIGADALLKATKVDGIYTADPKKDPKAKKYASLKYETALEKRLKVMDSAAFALCMDNGIPIVVFDFFDKNALEGVIKGKTVGTLVS